MKKNLTFSKISTRLQWLEVTYHALQYFNLQQKYRPSKAEMVYIRLIINELQEMGRCFDWYCLVRDWTNDERNGRPLHSPEQWRKAAERLQKKWQRYTPDSEHLDDYKDKVNR